VFPRSLPPEALVGVPLERCSLAGESPARVFSSGEGDNSTGLFSGHDGIEALTSFGRRAQAARHLARGAKPTVDGEVVLSPWHAARARSLAERAERWRRCGELLFMAEREGRVVPVEHRCGDWRACHRCRDRRRYVLQSGGERVVQAAKRVLRVEMSRYYRGAEGRHSEKLFTLTVPHSGSVAVDAELVQKAWRGFLRQLTAHFKARMPEKKARKKSNISRVPWIRAFEVASTTEAHFHVHVWMLAPFVDQVLVHVWWGRALLAAGLPPERMPMKRWEDVGARDPRVWEWAGRPAQDKQVPWPVADLRRAHTADYVGKVGLCDYVMKTDGQKSSLALVHMANAYEALSGMRIVQWSMGWAPRRGQEGWHVRRATAMERAAWNANLAASSDKCLKSGPDVSFAAATETLDAHTWHATDGPGMPKARLSLAGDGRAFQLSL
jgi:hypothetical protein